MKLIAKKPCSFGGKKFFIGDEVPAELVLYPKQQEQFGVLELTEEKVGASAAKETDGGATEENAAPADKKASAKKGGKKPAEEVGEQ